MKTQTIFRGLLAGGFLLLIGSTALAQVPSNTFRPGDEVDLEVLMTFDVPGISYISQAGIDYYMLDVQEVQGDNILVTDPISEYTNLHLEVRSAGPTGQIRALVYNADAEEVYSLVSGVSGSPYLNGKVYFFTFVYNPDPQESEQPVHRIAALGLTANNQFGFFRVIDTFGHNYPAVANTVNDFQIWSSPATFAHGGSSHGPYYYKEVVVEAGSPTALGRRR